ncbi:glycosyl transferase family 28 and UDP-glucoronosyl domain protein [Metarhizium robertsii]|uniref:Sterol 3-beta-glucosyltransferase n=2 Tax=Metarhizium robertsii TaxID=568076 RepID=E9F370_METRA|nr:autophagy-related protein 26 [Metarhizium robertsii ARSEF 23]EFY97936.2 autophagy-related protein 26 [Metarhizium robertsii ARSEF 23]EXU97535.1 glycosyl transferase family 28 and UDP-glucoronosyl domain protein [Metarhizium robertsii]
MDSFPSLSPEGGDGAGAGSGQSAGADDGGRQRRIGRNPFKKRHDDPSATLPDLPDLLKHSDSDDEDSPNDPASKRGRAMSVNMNQSIFGLIAAAGSRVDFNTRFDDGSSDEEDSEQSKSSNGSRDLSQTIILPPRDKNARRGHKKKLSSGHRLLKSLSTLPKRKSKNREASRLSAPLMDSSDDARESADLATSAMPQDKEDNRLAPVMSRMLQARAEIASRPSFDMERRSSDLDASGDSDESSALAKRLMEIFEFDEPEQVIEEYPCWLLQSVLLQGFLYITAKHICFYAYLPKKAHVVAKSGYLSKSGKRNPKYHRYWFRLKGDVLSYYRDSTNLYFPHGQIDLRFGISANVVDKDKDNLHFNVITSHRTYNFKADSAPSAKEWVKSLQRVIFRSHNEGDSVKISLPIDNVIDIEETQMMDFSDTCKIRVVDNDETYAIDEYFFSFFNFGKEAIKVLKILVEDASSTKQTPGKLIAEQELQSHEQPEQNSNSQPSLQNSPHPVESNPHQAMHVDKIRTTKLPEAVKATLSPMTPHSANPSPRASVECSSRTSLDAIRYKGRRSHEVSSMMSEQGARRSFSGHRKTQSTRQFDERRGRHVMESSDSNLHSSTEDPSFSNLVVSVATEDPSASQILKGSEVFHSPTMRRSDGSSQSTDAREEELSKHSETFLPDASVPMKHAATTGHINQFGYHGQADQVRSTTPTLQSITKMGSYPLQRAGAFADYLNKTSKRMSSLLATESMGYVEKVSGMWKGGRKHYGEPAGLRPDEDELEEDSEGKVQTSMERFRAHFALPESEKLQATYFGCIIRVLPLYGKIYISDRSFCFRSLLPGTRTKLILPLKDIETAHKEKGFRIGYSGLTVVIRGHEELFFEFSQVDVRDDCTVTLIQSLETNRYLREAGLLNLEEHEEEDQAMAERDALKSARQEDFPQHEILPPREADSQPNAPTILMDETDGSFLNFKPPQPMRITCLTIGSRGDVQPYIALCKGLLAEGHKPRIATHAEFQGWIESHGIEFAKVEGDPGELMRLCIENGTFTISFLREANSAFRGWLDELLDSAYQACLGSELLIESPSAMAGIHIAEKLGIPYFRAFTMPWTRTRAYPHAFIMPEHKMGGAYNYMTYVMFDNIFWKATAQQINRWRNKTLGLPNTSLEKMQPNKVPFLYNFSPSVVAPPLDFSDWIRVTGYWFLDEGGEYEPPKELSGFIQKARDDGKKLVYVGFGSIIVNDPVKMTQEVIDAVLKADVRCILSKGWSDRISPKDDLAKPRPDEPEMPAEIFVIKSAPHDWLFRQIDAAAHHGGSGTTGASLRAGIPTIIRPFFGDQFFFATRVEDLGVGVGLRRWGANSFGRALWQVTRNERMIVKARVLGEQIRKDKGVDTAIQNIYRDLEYAKSLIKGKVGRYGQPDADEDEDTEESWTFIGSDEPDPDMVTKKLSEGLGGVGKQKTLGNQAIKASS